VSALDSNPANKNFLSPLNFSFKIKKAPYTNFFIQKVNVPRMMLPDVQVPTPFINLPKPGDHITFESLSITFKVDEDLQNYMEIYNWIAQMGKPQTFDQYATIQNQDPLSGLGIYSDIELIILDGKRNPNYGVVFQDAFPTDLGELQFESTADDIDFVTTSATFKYKLYTIEKI
jgi:hypothetical protein